MDETFSSIDLVTQCLMDTERTEAFKKAIFSVVKEGDIVLDSGTGSSVLSLFAAQAGAKKVYSFEIDSYVAKLARENVKNNGFENVIEVINEDIRNYKFSAGITFDVILMEMLTTGMVDEYQVWAVNQILSKGVTNEKTIFLPSSQQTYVTLLEADYSLFGLEFKMPLHLWKGFDGERIITEKRSSSILLNDVYFNTNCPEEFEKILEFKAEKDGLVNGLLIESTTVLAPGIEINDTLALNAPVVFPLENMEVTSGEVIKLKIKYFFGNGYRNFSVTLV